MATTANQVSRKQRGVSITSLDRPWRSPQSVQPCWQLLLQAVDAEISLIIKKLIQAQLIHCCQNNLVHRQSAKLLSPSFSFNSFALPFVSRQCPKTQAIDSDRKNGYSEEGRETKLKGREKHIKELVYRALAAEQQPL